MDFCKGRGTVGRCLHRPLRMGCRGGRPCPPGPDNATPCRAGPVCPAVECGKNPVRAVGEIGEALPVADEASRFRGSAPIGGHDSDRESVGTTVGNRRPLRKRILWCVGEGLCPSRGRPQGSPLRKRYKRHNERATARVAPTKTQQEVQ